MSIKKTAVTTVTVLGTLAAIIGAGVIGLTILGFVVYQVAR